MCGRGFYGLGITAAINLTPMLTIKRSPQSRVILGQSRVILGLMTTIGLAKGGVTGRLVARYDN